MKKYIDSIIFPVVSVLVVMIAITLNYNVIAKNSKKDKENVAIENSYKIEIQEKIKTDKSFESIKIDKKSEEVEERKIEEISKSNKDFENNEEKSDKEEKIEDKKEESSNSKEEEKNFEDIKSSQYPAFCSLKKNNPKDVLIVFNNASKAYGLISDRKTSTWSDVLWQWASIPSGNYKVTLESFDGYPGRSLTVGQNNERFYVKLYGADSKLIATTGASNDVADFVEQSYWKGSVGNISLNKDITSITLNHVTPYFNANPNSHIPVCMLLESLDKPTPTPTNGECNSRYNGKELNQKPTIDICSKGKASTVTGTGTKDDPWKWSCGGLNGGSTAKCSATKKIPNPAIQIIKDDNDNKDDNQIIRRGEKAVFSIKVKNIGNVNLTNVIITDTLSPNCNKTIGDLAIGETKSYTCSIENVTNSFTNIAVVNGKYGETNVTDDDSSNVTITPTPTNGECNSQYNGKELDEKPTTNICTTGNPSEITGDGSESNPWRWTCSGFNGGTTANCSAKKKVPTSASSIKIVKDDNGDHDDTQRVNEGGTATFTIVVTNDGEERLTNISVTDSLAPNCAKTVSEVNTIIQTKYGSSHNYLDPLEFFEYTCTDENVTADYTNTATAQGTGSVVVEDSDTSNVIIGTSCEPEIFIEKNDNDNKDDTQTINNGETATFTIKVSNRGTERLTNISVTDSLAPNCAKTVSEVNTIIQTKYGSGHNYLDPLEFFEYTCTDENVTESYVNNAISRGEGVDSGKVVEDSDESNVIVNPLIPNPAIQIIKDDNDNSDDTQTIISGGTATFKISVKNIGNVNLTNVIVTDTLSPNCNKTIGDLAIGETKSYTCSIENVTNSFTNIAVVNGKYGETNVTDDDSSNVTITPTPTNGECNSQYNGKELDEKPTTNICTTGNPSEITGDGSESNPWRWTCSGFNGGTTANCSAKKKVPAEFPVIEIIKNDNDNGDDTQTVEYNGTATFKITVKNKGNIRLENIFITDSLAPNCAKTVSEVNTIIQTKYGSGHNYLDPLEFFEYTCTDENIKEGYTNIINISATGNSQIIDDLDTSFVIVNGNGDTSIDINKTAKNGDDTQTIEKGEDAYFKITVKNTGTTRINQIYVTDSFAPDCNLSVSEASVLMKDKYGRSYLEPNEFFTYECKDEDVEESYNNVAIVTGVNDDEFDQDYDTSKVVVEDDNDDDDKCDSSIGDLIWNDRDKDGVKDSSEEGIGGVRLKLYNGNDVIKTTTDSRGNYEFDDLCEGEYKVVVAVETLSNGCYQTYDKDGKLDNSTSTELDNDEDYEEADFGYYCPSNSSISSGTSSPATGTGILAIIGAILFATGSAWFSFKRFKTA